MLVVLKHHVRSIASARQDFFKRAFRVYKDYLGGLGKLDLADWAFWDWTGKLVLEKVVLASRWADVYARCNWICEQRGPQVWGH